MEDLRFDIRRIMTLLPHRYPFLLVDKVLSSSDPGDPKSRVGKKSVGIKNVTFNEPYFTGHFPDVPIMPGVLQLEAMAQLAALSYYRENDPPMDFMIASISEARFRRPVVPGDVLTMSTEIVRDRGSMIQVETKAHVEGELVAEAKILAYVSLKGKI
jgi:3-hydroxyacyl-[acyl-carrier-protein] dehydratase